MRAVLPALLAPLLLLILATGALAEASTPQRDAEPQPTDEAAALGYVGDPERGAEMAKLCTSCHGYQGRSVTSRYPSIAGMDETRFIEGMKALRAGERGHRMASMTRGLSDQDIADLAAHYSRLEAPERP